MVHQITEDKTVSEQMKIYCAVVGKYGQDDLQVAALAEDGEFVAGHISSSVYWAQNDIGITSTRKHELYQKQYPQGYELVWIDDIEKDARWKEAYAKNQAIPDEECVTK